MSLTKKQAKKLYRREVYRNLHFRDEIVYSVRKDGLIEGHALCQVMDECTFAVGPKGNQRVRDEQRKNVHAVIRGHVINTVWYDENELDWAKGAAEDMANIEMCGVPSSLNTGMNPDDPAAWTPMFEWKQVLYNPYRYQTFVTVEPDFDDSNIITTPIFYARKVVIGPTVWAMVPTANKQMEN
jgi:hypothetical protein